MWILGLKGLRESRLYRVVALDHYTFLGNCPPTPPLSQHFALSEK